jgi:phage FluMu gp28-like protein
VDILKNVWNCRYIAVDATGIGEPIASFLRQALGSKVLPFKFTQKSKSELGFDLLAAINSGRLKLYQQDGSADYEELMFELRKAQGIYRPNQTLNFFVDAADGHDDYLMSLTLAVHAASRCQPRIAKGRPRSP